MRVDLQCGISYGDDLEKVKSVAMGAIDSVSSRNTERDVEFFYEEFGDSSINFVARFWIEYGGHQDFLAARSEGIMRLKKAFDENDIMIPFPIRTLDFGIKGGERLATVLESKRGYASSKSAGASGPA